MTEKTEIEKQLAAALTEVLSLVGLSTDLDTVHAVYFTPAERLRQQARQIERNDEIVKQARATLHKFNNIDRTITGNTTSGQLSWDPNGGKL